MFRILRVVGKEQRDDVYDELFTKYGTKIEGKLCYIIVLNNGLSKLTRQ